MNSQLTRLLKSLLTNLETHNTQDGIYKYLGCVDYACLNQTNLNVSVHGSTLDSLSFGKYVSQNDTEQKINVIGSKQFIASGGHFKPVLIKSIYRRMSNNQVLSSAIKQKCLNQSLKVNSDFYWSVFVKYITGVPEDFKDLYNNTSRSGTVYMSRDCSFSSALLTLVAYLQNFVSWTSVVWTLSACETGAPTGSCDEINDSIESVLAFCKLAINFTDEELLKQVNDLFKSRPENDIVRTMSFKDLIVGKYWSVGLIPKVCPL